MEEQSELASLNLPCDYATFGGYDGAERAVAAFGNGCQYAEFPVKIIKAEPLSQKFADKLSHRDFLGSLMGLGIKRNVLGDIVIKENTGYIFCLDSIADYIVQNLDKVRHTGVKCSVVHELPAGAVAEPEEKEIIVASLRLDVLAAAVYNFSRSGVKELFVQRKVFVNSALCENFSLPVTSPVFRYTLRKADTMKKLVIGILAHVDAGKTTLSEAMLYRSGAIRSLGRVDHRDAFLDTDALERERGITIFSKQAMLRLDDCSVTLLDTPGHVDFSAEMERTLQVLDYAVLVVSGTSGVQGHTHTLWQLLRRYQIPTFLFVNKMDIDGTDREALLHQLKAELSEGCIDFGADSAELSEQLALLDDEVAERYLESGTVSTEDARQLIARRSA